MPDIVSIYYRRTGKPNPKITDMKISSFFIVIVLIFTQITLSGQETGKASFYSKKLHGGAHSEGFMEANKMPTGLLTNDIVAPLNLLLKKQTGVDSLVWSDDNFQITFNKKIIKKNNLDFEKIKASTIDFLEQQKGIQFVADQDKIATTSIPEPIKTQMINGYNHSRSGSLVYIPEPA